MQATITNITCFTHIPGGRSPGGPDRSTRLPRAVKARNMAGQVSAQFQYAVPGRHSSYISRYDVVIVISRLPLIAGQPLAVTNDQNANNQKQLCSRIFQKQRASLSDQQLRKQAKCVLTSSMLASQRSVPRTPWSLAAVGEAESRTLALTFATSDPWRSRSATRSIHCIRAAKPEVAKRACAICDIRRTVCFCFGCATATILTCPQWRHRSCRTHSQKPHQALGGPLLFNREVAMCRILQASDPTLAESSGS